MGNIQDTLREYIEEFKAVGDNQEEQHKLSNALLDRVIECIDESIDNKEFAARLIEPVRHLGDHLDLPTNHMEIEIMDKWLYIIGILEQVNIEPPLSPVIEFGYDECI